MLGDVDSRPLHSLRIIVVVLLSRGGGGGGIGGGGGMLGGLASGLLVDALASQHEATVVCRSHPQCTSLLPQ